MVLGPEASPPSSPFIDVPHVIQLAIAPVFLLTSIGTILSVLSHRLSRIVDRMRVLIDRLAEPELGGSARMAMRGEVSLLCVRRKFVHQAIVFSTMAAIFVALLIVSAFVGALATANVSIVLAVLFMLALVAFVGALVSFLREVLLAGRSFAAARQESVDPNQSAAD